MSDMMVWWNDMMMVRWMCNDMMMVRDGMM